MLQLLLLNARKNVLKSIRAHFQLARSLADYEKNNFVLMLAKKLSSRR
jgi:peptide subunit release factor 1 (eRF1)